MMVNVKYLYITKDEKIIKVEYILKVDDKENWKEKVKEDFCNIINSHDDDLIYIKIGV